MSSATRSSYWRGADLIDPATQDSRAAQERSDRARRTRGVPRLI